MNHKYDVLNQIIKIIAGVALAVGVISAGYYLIDVVLYVIASAVLALIGRPIVRILETKNIKFIGYLTPSQSAFITLLLVFSVPVIFLVLFIPLLMNELELLSRVNPNTLLDAFKPTLQSLGKYLEQFGIITDPYVSAKLYVTDHITTWLNTSALSHIVNIFSFAGEILVSIFAISFLTFFMLKQGRELQLTIIKIMPDEYEASMIKVVDETKRLMRRYILGVIVQVTTMCIIYFIIFNIIGLKHVIIISLFTGIINIIPYIGPWMGALFSMLVTISLHTHLPFVESVLPLLLLIAATVLFAEIIDNFFIQPLIFSNSVEAHPVEIFLVIIIAAELAGIGGMIVAVPTYTVLKIIAHEFFHKFKLVQVLTDKM